MNHFEPTGDESGEDACRGIYKSKRGYCQITCKDDLNSFAACDKDATGELPNIDEDICIDDRCEYDLSQCVTGCKNKIKDEDERRECFRNCSKVYTEYCPKQCESDPYSMGCPIQ